MRRVRRVKATFAAQEQRFVVRSVADGGARRTLTALAAEAEAESAKVEARLPPVEVECDDVCRSELQSFFDVVDGKVLCADGRGLFEWFEKKKYKAVLKFRGRSRSERAALYEMLEDFQGLRGESQGFGTERALFVYSAAPSRRKTTAATATSPSFDVFWDLVRAERDRGGTREAQELSRGELEAILLSGEKRLPSWLASLLNDLAAKTANRAAAVDATIRGDLPALKNLLETQKSLLFYDAVFRNDAPIAHVAVAHRQFQVLAFLVDDLGLDPKRHFHRQSGESAADLAIRLYDDPSPRQEEQTKILSLFTAAGSRKSRSSSS